MHLTALLCAVLRRCPDQKEEHGFLGWGVSHQRQRVKQGVSSARSLDARLHQGVKTQEIRLGRSMDLNKFAPYRQRARRPLPTLGRLNAERL